MKPWRKQSKGLSILVIAVLGLSAFSFFTIPQVHAESLNAWTKTSIPTQCDQLVIGKDIGYAFCVAHTSHSYYAPILAGGGFGNWAATTVYPQNFIPGACAYSNNVGTPEIICVGEQGGPGSTLTYSVSANSAGLGTWNAGPAYPLTIEAPSCTANSVQIICVGGYDVGGAAYSKKVYYAPLIGLANGWIASTDYGVVAYRVSCAYGGSVSAYLFCVGGVTTGGVYITNSYAGLVNSNGGITSWTAGTAYPLVIADCSATILTISNVGYLYCMGGGQTTGGVQQTAINYASLSGNTVGSWIGTTPLPSAFANPATRSCDADANGYAECVIGGPPTDAEFTGTSASVGQTASTTVINTSCLGACSGGNNGTKTHFSSVMPNLFVFMSSLNTGTGAQIDNFTMKVANAHMTTNPGIFYVLVYEPATPTLPASGANLWTLVANNGQTTVQIANNTVDKFIHSNPQTNICANCYYAVGIFGTTTASRGSGAVGNGVRFYETSQIGVNEYSYDMGGITPAGTFYSNTKYTPNFYIFVHATFAVATVTTTSTTTVGGTATTTSTVTSTNTVNQLNMASAGFWFVPLMFLLLPMGLLITVKRVADGRG